MKVTIIPVNKYKQRGTHIWELTPSLIYQAGASILWEFFSIGAIYLIPAKGPNSVLLTGDGEFMYELEVKLIEIAKFKADVAELYAAGVEWPTIFSMVGL